MKTETPRDLRKRMKRLEEGRDDWKGKQRGSQYAIKIMRNKLGAASESRDSWKRKSKESEKRITELQELTEAKTREITVYQEEAAQLRQELEDLKKMNKQQSLAGNLQKPLAISMLISASLWQFCWLSQLA